MVYDVFDTFAWKSTIAYMYKFRPKIFEPLLASPLCFLFCKYAQDKSLYGMYL